MRCPICKTSLKDDEINVCDKCRTLPYQLVEKDKELAELKDRLEYITGNENGIVRVFDITDHNKELRHQVCEEIRAKLKKCITPACGTYIVYYEAKNVEDTLDQIEQGEKKCK